LCKVIQTLAWDFRTRSRDDEMVGTMGDLNTDGSNAVDAMMICGLIIVE
jgi:hypothetical protein